MEEQELQKNSNIALENEIKTENTQKNLGSLPRYEDMLLTEKQVKPKQEISGLTQAKTTTKTQDKEFAKKQDLTKINAKRRIKIVTGVYSVVASLLAIFAIVNVVTLVILNKQVTTNLETIQTKQSQVEQIENVEIPSAGEEINLILGTPPRDYDNDNKELSFWDKVSILFKSIFG